MKVPRGMLRVTAALAVAVAGYWVWQSKQPAPLPSEFASGNGRIEAVDIDIAAKTAGRVREILVDEGDMVQLGQTVARMDTDSLASELRQAEAQVKRSENARATAIAVVRQRESMRTSAEAVVAQRKAELALAETELKRSQDLVARSMPQFGLLLILVLLPLQILSGATTPRESMPAVVQHIMTFAPTTHFVSFAQAILYRGAGLDVVWPQLLATAAIGVFFFAGALVRFRKAITTQQG